MHINKLVKRLTGLIFENVTLYDIQNCKASVSDI